MALKVLHLSDFHLDHSLKYLKRTTSGQKRLLEIEDCLQWLVERTEELSIDLVLLCGDQFDHPQPANQAKRLFLNFLDQLNHRAIQVVMISGNHDMMAFPQGIYSNISLFSPAIFLDHPRITTPTEITIRHHHIYLYGFSYTPGKSPLSSFEDFERVSQDGIHLALLHGSLKTREDIEVDVHYMPLSPEKLGRTAMDYIALGHYHKKAIHPLDQGVCAYPGSPWALGFRASEGGPRYGLQITLEEGKQAQVEPVDLAYPHRRIVEEQRVSLTGHDFSGPGELGDWLKKRYGHQDKMVKIILEGLSPLPSLDIEGLEESLRRDFFCLGLQSQLDFIRREELESLSKEKTIRGRCIARLLDKIQQHPEQKALLDLALGYVVRALE